MSPRIGAKNDLTAFPQAMAAPPPPPTSIQTPRRAPRRPCGGESDPMEVQPWHSESPPPPPPGKYWKAERGGGSGAYRPPPPTVYSHSNTPPPLLHSVGLPFL